MHKSTRSAKAGTRRWEIGDPRDEKEGKRIEASLLSLGASIAKEVAGRHKQTRENSDRYRNAPRLQSAERMATTKDQITTEIYLATTCSLQAASCLELCQATRNRRQQLRPMADIPLNSMWLAARPTLISGKRKKQSALKAQASSEWLIYSQSAAAL